MSLANRSSPTSGLRVLVASCLIAAVGCSGGGSAPTKIYEGGGTIPEIVDQPEKPVDAGKGARKK